MLSTDWEGHGGETRLPRLGPWPPEDQTSSPGLGAGWEGDEQEKTNGWAGGVVLLDSRRRVESAVTQWSSPLTGAARSQRPRLQAAITTGVRTAC